MDDYGQPFIFGRKHKALVTGIKNILDDAGNDTGFFSGYISVRLLSTNDTLEWVKWTNPLIGQDYGVITIPVPNQDVVMVAFDLRNKAYTEGMTTYPQATRIIGDLAARTGELQDKRLKIQPGELLLRGRNKASIYFKNDGTVTLMADDTNANGVKIVLDQNNNITVTNGQTVAVSCKDATLNCSDNAVVNATNKAQVTAAEIDVISGNVQLGNGPVKAPIIRSIDPVITVDSFGIPLVSEEYVTQSANVQSS